MTYAYDALGRLIQTVSSDGSGVEYNYDAVGNITAIRRLDTATLQVLDFVPRTGTPGTAVTVYGGGFDPTASANAVTFNGVAATVTGATATNLTVQVPSGASTGPIVVSDSHGTAASATNFTVLGTLPIPTITGFSPKVATMGTVVTLSGTNFQLDANVDKVQINGRVADVVADATSPAAMSLKLIVPTTTSSGYISLTTPYGTAVSADELVAVPSTIDPATVDYSGRIALGGPPVTVTTTAAGHKAALLFEAQAGQSIHAVTSGSTYSGGTMMYIYDPNGDLARTIGLNNVGVSDVTPALTLTGTYTAIVSPTAAGHISVNLVADVAGALTMNGATSIALAPGQNAVYSFAAQANTGYGLALANLTITPAGGTVNVRVTKPDGTVVTTCSFVASASCDLDPTSFATTGTYLVVLDPVNAFGASFDAVIEPDLTGTATLDQSTALTFTYPGQNAKYTFNNPVAGQRVNAVFTGSTIDDGNSSTTSSTQVLIYGPTGGYLGSDTFNSFVPGLALDMTLPAAGSYTIWVKTSGVDTGTVDMAIKTEATGAMTLDGATAIALSAGRNGRYTFSAQASTGYGLGMTAMSFTPTGVTFPVPAVNVTLRKTDGTALTTCQFQSASSCNFDPSYFTTTGTYLIDFDPTRVYGASFTASLSTDAMNTMTIGSTVLIAIARPGQNARYTFSGTTGQSIDAEPSNDSISGDPNGNNGTDFRVLSPSGATIIGESFFPTASNLKKTAVLGETGTYTVLVDPLGANSGHINVSITASH